MSHFSTRLTIQMPLYPHENSTAVSILLLRLKKKTYSLKKKNNNSLKADIPLILL